MFHKMMMKMQRERRPSKSKGKGLLWYLKRNAKLRKLKKFHETTRRKKKKSSDNLKKGKIHFSFVYFINFLSHHILSTNNLLCHLRVMEIFLLRFWKLQSN